MIRAHNIMKFKSSLYSEAYELFRSMSINTEA